VLFEHCPFTCIRPMEVFSPVAATRSGDFPRDNPQRIPFRNHSELPRINPIVPLPLFFFSLVPSRTSLPFFFSPFGAYPEDLLVISVRCVIKPPPFRVRKLPCAFLQASSCVVFSPFYGSCFRVPYSYEPQEAYETSESGLWLFFSDLDSCSKLNVSLLVYRFFAIGSFFF